MSCGCGNCSGNPCECSSAEAVGFTGTITLVTNVTYSAPNIIQTRQSFSYQNGLLTTIGTAVDAIVTAV